MTSLLIYNRGYNFYLSMARFVGKEDRGPMEVKVGNESSLYAISASDDCNFFLQAYL
jgi:hypothetical protein